MFKIYECILYTVILKKQPAVIIIRYKEALLIESLKNQSVIRKRDSPLMTGVPVFAGI